MRLGSTPFPPTVSAGKARAGGVAGGTAAALPVKSRPGSEVEAGALGAAGGGGGTGAATGGGGAGFALCFLVFSGLGFSFRSRPGNAIWARAEAPHREGQEQTSYREVPHGQIIPWCFATWG